MKRLVAFLMCVAGPLVAQDTAQDGGRLLQEARAQLTAAQEASDRIAALTQTVKAYEQGLQTLRLGQREIALRDAELSAQVAADRAEIAQLLAALTTISRTPQTVQRAHPSGPVDTLRAGMLLAAVTPALEAEAANVQALLSEVRAIKAAQDAAAQNLQDGLEGAQQARAALGQAMSERTDLPARFVDDPVQTALFVASAQTLDEFASQLASSRPDEPTGLIAAGDLPLPVDGIVLPNDGSGRAGVRIGAAPRALVTAPVAATILFQGALLDYGTVVILEPAPDVLFVMAGFEEVFGQTGEVVAAGAPIGLLGDDQRYDDGILTENSGIRTGNRTQTLYLEVRDGQGSVTPDAWFALE